MPSLHATGPADPGDGPPRPATFAARLRANLPTSPADIAIYAAMAAALRLFLHFTWPAALTLTAGAAAAGVVVFAALDQVMARHLPAEHEDDEDAGGGDG